MSSRVGTMSLGERSMAPTTPTQKHNEQEQRKCMTKRQRSTKTKGPSKTPKILATRCEELTQELVLSQLDYNPYSGYFTRRKNGKPVGSDHGNGYLTVYVLGKHYYAHRLAWLYVTGEWPKDDIDHIDGNRINNSWGNLREATRSQNLINKIYPKKELPKNIYWLARTARYRVKLSVNNKTIHGGYFKNLGDAEQAVSALRKTLYGDFAKVYSDG